MDLFSALGDPVRRGLLDDLAAGPSRVVDLTAAFAISRPAISRHLGVLRSARLVQVTARGRECWYALDHAGLDQAQTWLASLTRSAPVREVDLDALDVEVRRTRRDRPATQPHRLHEESA